MNQTDWVLAFFYPTGETSEEGGFQFSSGLGQSIKVEIPSDLPEGLKLIGATLGRTTHYAVLCSKSSFAKGRRFGPYNGRNVQPTEMVPGVENPFMWEVNCCCRVERITPFCDYSFNSSPECGCLMFAVPLPVFLSDSAIYCPRIYLG